MHRLYEEGSAYSKSGRILYGRGHPECDKSLPTLSVAKENLIETKAEWDIFLKENPLIVVSISDSKCIKCCRAEPIL